MLHLKYLILVLLLCGCAGMPDQEQPSQPSDLSGVKDSGDRLEAVGIGAPNPILPTTTQRKATSRDAALLKARYELSSAVRALVLQSGITLEAAIDLEPSLDDGIKRAVADANIHTEFTPDDGCIVRLSLSKSKLAENLGVRFK